MECAILCRFARSGALHGEEFFLKSRKFAAVVLFASFCVALFFGVSAGAQSRGPLPLDAILKRLDEQAPSFRSVSAKVQRTKVTVVVNDRSTDTGAIFVRGDKMLLRMDPPDARTVLKTGATLYVFNPGLERVEEYNLGKNRTLVDEFLLLGFGTPGKQLAKGYQIKLVGEAALLDKKTVELELTPKSEQVLHQISRVNLWLDEVTWLPVQQEVYETGSGDYSIIQYSEVARNAEIPDSKFKPHWPKGTVKVKPQS